jgi:tetratricopeptide (TPR) repeat protein
MFRYPQRRGVDLFSPPAEHFDLGTYFQESRLFLDLGQVNQADRCAYEALATSGEHPALLEQLAMIHVVKGRPETARMFLNALAKHLFYRQAAREMLRRLDADPALENDRRASRIRGNMASRDSIAQVTSVEDFLQLLLEKNPHNKMAFELLMAHYLSDGRPDKVVANLRHLKDFSYLRAPRHYQEALAVQALSSDRPPQVPGFELDPEILGRARDFQRIVAGATSPQEAVRAALEAGLGDSYFFYLACGASGR